jgi:hypothetical protein
MMEEYFVDTGEVQQSRVQGSSWNKMHKTGFSVSIWGPFYPSSEEKINCLGKAVKELRLMEWGLINIEEEVQE